MKRKDGSYNSTKKRTLEVFEDQTWMDVPTFARKAGIRPVRRAYTYLSHLAELNLVERGHTARGKLFYKITPRGLDRLQWLRAQKSSITLEELITPFLRSN